MFNSRKHKLPELRFKAVGSRDSFNNVNFAREQAQRMADASQQPVDVIHVVNGRDGMKIFSVDPSKEVVAITN